MSDSLGTLKTLRWDRSMFILKHHRLQCHQVWHTVPIKVKCSSSTTQNETSQQSQHRFCVHKCQTGLHIWTLHLIQFYSTGIGIHAALTCEEHRQHLLYPESFPYQQLKILTPTELFQLSWCASDGTYNTCAGYVFAESVIWLHVRKIVHKFRRSRKENDTKSYRKHLKFQSFKHVSQV